MTLRDIYRDIVSRLNVKDFDQEYYFLDGVEAINDAIASLRVQYVENNRADLLSETHQLFFSFNDTLYPYLGSADLPKPLISTPNIERAVINGITWVTTNVVGQGEFPKGTLAQLGNRLVKSVQDITSNDQVGAFKQHEFRNFRNGNCVKYWAGDVIKSPDGNYYKVLEYFYNNGEQDFADSARFEQVYWVDADCSPYTIASFYNPKRISELKYVPHEFPAFTIWQNKVYVTQSPQQFTLTYVPEWQKVEDLNAQLNLPPDMLGQIKQLALEALQSKIPILNEQR